MKAIWNGVELASSNETIVVEGNHYFPEESINKQFFKNSKTKTTCPWKGTAHYFTLDVNGSENPDAAWYYPNPKPMAKPIKNRVAFWKGVEVVD